MEGLTYWHRSEHLVFHASKSSARCDECTLVDYSLHQSSAISFMLADHATNPLDLLFDGDGQYHFDSAPASLHESQSHSPRHLGRRLGSESIALSHLLDNQETMPKSAACLESPPQDPLNNQLPRQLSLAFQDDETRAWYTRHSPEILQPSMTMLRYSMPFCLPDASSGFSSSRVSAARTAPTSYLHPSQPYGRPVGNDPQAFHRNVRSSLPDYLPPSCPPPDYVPSDYPPPNHPPPGHYPSPSHPLAHQPHASYPELQPLLDDLTRRSTSLGDFRPVASATSQRPDVHAPQLISSTPALHRRSYGLAACYSSQTGYRAPEISVPRSYSMPLSQTPSTVHERFSGSLCGVISPAAMALGCLSATQAMQVSSPEAEVNAASSDTYFDELDEEEPPAAGPSSVRQRHKPHNMATSDQALTPARLDDGVRLSWQEPLVDRLKRKKRTTSRRKRNVDCLDGSDANEERPKKRAKVQTRGKLSYDALRSRKYRAKHKNFAERVKEELGDELPENYTREDLQETCTCNFSFQTREMLMLEKFILLRSKKQAYEDEIGELRGPAAPSKT